MMSQLRLSHRFLVRRALPIGISAVLCALALPSHAVVLTERATFPDATDVRVVEGQPSDRLGTAVAHAGDVNGDGLSDIIVSAPGIRWQGLEDRGQDRVYVIYGRAADGAIDVFPQPDEGFRLSLSTANLRQGVDSLKEVSGAGDVDGDGYSDVLISASLGTDEHPSGTAFVVYGGPDLEDHLDLADLPSHRGFAIHDSDPSRRSLGYSLAGLGDVNGDGLDDVGLSSLPGDNSAVAAFVILGNAQRPARNIDLSALAPASGFRIHPTPEHNVFYDNVRIAAAGDFNGDGLSDISIGISRHEEFETPVSSRPIGGYIAFGRADAADIVLSDPNVGLKVAMNPDRGFGRLQPLGAYLKPLGDVNGDGRADVGLTSSAMGSRGLYVIHGRKAGSLNMDQFSALDGVRILPERSEASATGRLAGIGDWNGDGLADMMVGNDLFAAGTYPTVTAILGTRESGVVSFPSSRQAAFHAGTWLGENLMGWSVSGAGDFDGDGFPNAVIGAPVFASLPGGMSGETYVVDRPTDRPLRSTYHARVVDRICDHGAAPMGANGTPVGGTGVGGDRAAPDARAWVRLCGGSGRGIPVTVTLQRESPAAVLPLGRALASSLSWSLGFGAHAPAVAEVTVKYIDSEVAALSEPSLSLRATGPGGLAVRLAQVTLDTERNILRAHVPTGRGITLAIEGAIAQ